MLDPEWDILSEKVCEFINLLTIIILHRTFININFIFYYEKSITTIPARVLFRFNDIAEVILRQFYPQIYNVIIQLSAYQKGWYYFMTKFHLSTTSTCGFCS